MEKEVLITTRVTVYQDMILPTVLMRPMNVLICHVIHLEHPDVLICLMTSTALVVEASLGRDVKILLITVKVPLVKTMGLVLINLVDLPVPAHAHSLVTTVKKTKLSVTKTVLVHLMEHVSN